jgi:predicted secreted Zn-dependent protease
MSQEQTKINNPLLTQAQSETQAVDPSLKEASQIFGMLQPDIQTHLIEEYIKPQLRGDDLVREFDKQLNSKDCSSLQWQVLVDIVTKIIENKEALAQMFEKYDDIGFKEYYEQHFIQKRNQFTQPSWDALSSFCATLTMCKWH